MTYFWPKCFHGSPESPKPINSATLIEVRDRATHTQQLDTMAKPVHSRAALAVALSKLKGFSEPKVSLEQYTTEPDVAADMIWNALMQGDIENKKVADLGAGTGFLGIGALILGAAEVIFVESESSALETARQNLAWAQETYGYEGTARFIEADVRQFQEEVDTVVENPPFGTKIIHADKAFLETALHIAKKTYSLHKTTSEAFVHAIARDHGTQVVLAGKYLYPLPATMAHHTQKRAFIEVSLFVFSK